MAVNAGVPVRTLTVQNTTLDDVSPLSHELIGLTIVTQLPLRDADENVVQRRVLNLSAFAPARCVHRHFHQRSRRAGAVGGQNAVHARCLVLDGSYFRERAQSLLQSAGKMSNCTSITVDPGTLAFKAQGYRGATSLP